jgi:hypothetical protein
MNPGESVESFYFVSNSVSITNNRLLDISRDNGVTADISK